MSFFRQFPKIGYDFQLNGIKQNVVDIFRHVKPIEEFVDNYTEYTFYNIVNGQRPDIVSELLYDTSQYYWTFFVINDFLHDGYRAWPMSQEDLSEYINEEYNGYAITSRPDRGADHSIAGKFEIGETIVGNTSGASGKLYRKNLDMNQLIVRDMVNATAYLGEGDDNIDETIQGATSGDVVRSYKVFKYKDAPYYYYKTNDVKKRPQTNALHIPGAIADSELSYVSYQQHEIELNEERSQIKIIDPNYIGQFAKTFENLLNA